MRKGPKCPIRTGPERYSRRPMSPHWAAFPNIARDSIGWRKGTGETYLMDSHRWYMRLDERAARQVQADWPAPVKWADFYDTYEGRRG